MVTSEEKLIEFEKIYANKQEMEEKISEIDEMLNGNLKNASNTSLLKFGIDVKNYTQYLIKDAIICSLIVGVIFFIIALIIGHIYEWEFSVKLGVGIIAAVIAFFKGDFGEDIDYRKIYISLSETKKKLTDKVHALENEQIYLDVKDQYNKVHSKYFKCTDNSFERYICKDLIILWKRSFQSDKSLSLENVMELLINNSEEYINRIMSVENTIGKDSSENTNKALSNYYSYLNNLEKLNIENDRINNQTKEESDFLKEMNITNESAESSAETNDNSLYDKSTNSAMERFRNQKK